jgi:nucleoside-diphosphate-sugar epimerase
MEKFLITGAMGFLGSHLAESLLKSGKIVYGIDLSPKAPHLLEYENFLFTHDTIKNTDVLKNIIDRVDVVCHLAGVAEPDQYIKYPRKVIDITGIVGVNLVDMCRQSGKLFFFTSTSEIYGKNTSVPFTEESDRVLGAISTRRWCYSTSKAMVEHYLAACGAEKELDFITVRLFNIYGPRLSGRVVSNFIRCAKNGEPFKIHGDGSQTRAFTFVDDAIDGFRRLIDNPDCYNEIFNVGNNKETTVKELAEVIRDVCNPDCKIEFQPHQEYYGDSYEDIPRRVPDVSKIRDYVGWEASTSLEDGVRRMFQEK